MRSVRFAFEDKAGNIQLKPEEITNYYKNGIMFYYNSYATLYYKNVARVPSLKCKGGVLNEYSSGESMFVGALTADEVIFAGNTTSGGTDISSYLLNSWGKRTGTRSYTLTPFKTAPSSNGELIFQFGH